jgi:hypothetical protein
MRYAIKYGLDWVEFEVAEGQWIPSRNPPGGLPDPAAAVCAALEKPHGFPSLRRALTPDDRVTIVLEDHLPRLVELLVPVLEHVISAGIDPGQITLLCPPRSTQPWLDELPDEFAEAHLEVHDPTNRQRLSYLSTNRKGRRLYINRTLVDADQIVLLSRRGYDPLLGYGGAEGALGPVLCDEETRAELSTRVNLGLPGPTPWETQEEAIETAWLLGAPFYVQIIEGGGDEIAYVVAGSTEASREGQRLLDLCWRQTIVRPADLVVASLSGNPDRHTFADLAAALACAARVVKPNGRIVLLTQDNSTLGPERDRLRQVDDPRTLVAQLQNRLSLDLVPLFQWAQAAQQARINLLSGWADEIVEEMFATPLENAHQAQRLINAGGSCVFLPDAHKSLVVVERP